MQKLRRPLADGWIQHVEMMRRNVCMYVSVPPEEVDTWGGLFIKLGVPFL